MAAIYIITFFIGSVWGVLNMWAYYKEGSMVNMYVGISTLILMVLVFSLLLEYGVVA